jgi:hypothetical protein
MVKSQAQKYPKIPKKKAFIYATYWWLFKKRRWLGML